MNSYTCAFATTSTGDGAEGAVQYLCMRADAFTDQLAKTDGVDADSIKTTLSQSSSTVFSQPGNGGYTETTYTIFVQYEAMERHLPGETVSTKPASFL